MKSKREIEKTVWPLISSGMNLSSQNDHAEYMRVQRYFQKMVSEQLNHNPITAENIVLKVNVTFKDVLKLLKMDNPPLRKPSQKA